MGSQPIIDIISTGSGCAPSVLEKCSAFIEDLGFTARSPQDFFDDHPLYICNNEQRFLNLKQALYAKDSEFIWCLRGGSGTSCLLPELLKLTPPKISKTLMGFSDVTALHLFLTQHWGWKTIHGPTLNAFALSRNTASVQKHVQEILQDKKTSIKLPLTSLNDFLKAPMKTSITGGNLALIQMSLGTPWQIKSKDKILFFEDINEAPYRIAEMLTHLKNAGVFEGVKAVLFGGFSGEKSDAKEGRKQEEGLLDFVLQDFADSAPFPVFKNFAVGHTDNNHPVHLGGLITLTPKDDGTIYTQYIKLGPGSF